MSKPGIATLTPREHILVYWLLRAYQSGHREGWEPGPSVGETMDGLHALLCNMGLDPNLSDEARALLDNPPRTRYRLPVKR